MLTRDLFSDIANVLVVILLKFPFWPGAAVDSAAMSGFERAQLRIT